MNNSGYCTVIVSHHGETPLMWAVLVDHTIAEDTGLITGFSRVEWFHKDKCFLDRVKGDPKITTLEHVYELKAPRWLLKDRRVKYTENHQTKIIDEDYQDTPETKKPSEDGNREVGKA